MRRRLGDWRARWRCTLPGCPTGGLWHVVEVSEGGGPAQAGYDALAAHYAVAHRDDDGRAAA